LWFLDGLKTICMSIEMAMSTLNTKLNVGVNGDVTHELGFQRSSQYSSFYPWLHW